MVNMSKQKTFLILIVLFSLLFVVLVTTGSYLISFKTLPEKQYGIAAFLFAFAAIFGQIACLALYIRQRVRTMAAQQMTHSSTHQDIDHVESNRSRQQ